jgi:hypothetical protein
MKILQILNLTSILFVLACTTNESKDSADKKNSTIPNIKSDTNTSYNVTINDTFFFRRLLTKSYIDIVFINKDRNNNFYKTLQNNSEIDIKYIYEYFSSPLKRINTRLLPDKWIELIRYNGEFYVNRPSNDWYNINIFIINDSLFISCLSDPYIRPLKSLIKLNEKKFELKYLDINFETKNKIEDKMNIYIIDKKRQIFLFENFTTDSAIYYFATPTKNVFFFDLIDIYNSQSKSHSNVREDKINYKELIKNH